MSDDPIHNSAPVKTGTSVERFSWKTLADGSVLKELDFSAFDEGVTGVPQSFYTYFDITKSENKKIELTSVRAFNADLKWTRPSSPIVRLHWASDFAEVLKQQFPAWTERAPNDGRRDMKLIFKKQRDNVFSVSFADGHSILGQQIDFELAVSGYLSKPLGPPDGVASPDSTVGRVWRVKRDARVHAWVIQNAEGECEACAKPAPFKTEDGRGFLEVHHVQRLSDGGADTIWNAIAVCPNCHRELHFGKDRTTKVAAICKRIERLRRA